MLNCALKRYLALTLTAFAIGYATARPWPAMALEYRFGMGLADAFVSQANYLDLLEGDFSRDRNYNLLTLSPNLSLSLQKDAFVYISGDFQWRYEPNMDAQTAAQDDELDAELTNAYLSLKKAPLELILGVQLVQFGNSLITLDNVPALALNYTRSAWYLNLQAARVLDKSPMGGIALGYKPGPFERVGLFAAWFQDEENALAKALPDFFPIAPNSEARLWWFGADAQLFLGKALLTLTAAYEQGEITLSHRRGSARQDVSAYLADVELQGNLSDRCDLGLFFFTASGDDNPRDHRIESFLSPTPYNARAMIFFDPEWLNHDTEEAVLFGGATVNGVIAPGLTFSFVPSADGLLKATVASFYPQATAVTDGEWYGWEADLLLSWNLWRDVTGYLQAARFEYGDYFKNHQGAVPDPALLFAIGGRIAF